MLREKIPIGRAKKPRLQRAIEVIQSVREERSKKARGDFLLHQAQISLDSSDIDSAKSYLDMFLIASAPDVSAEHHAVINIVLTKLLAHQKLKIPSTVLNLLDLLLGILKLVGRNLLSCQSLGILIPVFIDEEYRKSYERKAFFYFRHTYRSHSRTCQRCPSPISKSKNS